MENITIIDYINHLEELLTKLMQIANKDPNIKLKTHTLTTAIYPANKEEALKMYALMRVTPMEYDGSMSADIKLKRGTAYVHYSGDKK